MTTLEECAEVEKCPIFDEEFEGSCEYTFCLNRSVSDLQLDTFCSKNADDGLHWMGKEVVRRSISTISEMQHFEGQSDPCQVFCIRQKNSYSRLYVTQGLFQQLVDTYSIFPHIWDFVLPFGFKTRKSDVGNAPFKFRQLEPARVGDKVLGSFECAYSFRYPVLNHRLEGLDENPDYDPWSIRHTAVYQQYNSTKERSMFLLISPADTSRRKVEDAVNANTARQVRIDPFDLHRILLSTLHRNWRAYIRDLEVILQERSDRVTLSKADVETDLRIPFLERQRLKMTEDKILDLTIIFESLHNTLSQLQRQCQSHCLGTLCIDCTCSNIIQELDDQIQEVRVNLKKTEVLHKRAQSTAQLVSDGLAYENAQVTNWNARSLHQLTLESKDENFKMRILTERSARDAAAVKILTVITLIYLPVTVVASIFSSQLIQVDDSGRLSVIAESWWFVVVSLPLTIFTFILWRYWLSYSMKRSEPKQLAKLSSKIEANEIHQISPSIKTRFAELSRCLQNLRNYGKGPVARDLP